MFISAVGHSEDPDTPEAVNEIREQCEQRLAGHQPSAGVLFAAIDYDYEELLAAVNEFWPGLELIGCSTDGETSSDIGFMEDSVVLILFASDTIEIKAGVGEGLSEDSDAACFEAVKMARSKTTKKEAMCLALPDALSNSGQHIVDCLVSELGKDVPVIGGTAGDQWRLQKTYQFYGKQVLSDSVPVLLFSGPLELSFSLGLGCISMGDKATVTKSEGATLLEIDSEPAANFYKKMLGENTTRATEIPLAVLDKNGEIDYLRTPATDFDPVTGSVPMFADIREGSIVKPVMLNTEALLASCTEAGQAVEAGYSSRKPPSAALVFSCAGRKILLGTRTVEEQKRLAGVMDHAVPTAGFYTYGEICPSVSVEEGAKFHNHTIVVALLGERDE